MQDYYDHRVTNERKTWSEWVEEKGFQTVKVLIDEKILLHKDFTQLIKENFKCQESQ